MTPGVGRREFIAALGGMVVWPLAARAQRAATPIIGYLGFTAVDERPNLLTAFLQGLEQTGFVVGHNVTIEYRSADGHYEQLPVLAAELVRLTATVIVATGGEASVRAAKAATAQIPIVFTTGSDPVKAGLVEALNRPGGNATGVSLVAAELDPKRLQLLHDLLPQVSTIGVLVNAKSPTVSQDVLDMKAAAAATGQRLVILSAGTDSELNSTFASLQQQGIGALLITTNPFFEGRRDQLVALAAQYGLPVLYPWRDYVAAGGLISYGSSFPESYRQVGLYTGRILKGEKPANLPVVQPAVIGMVINLKTAKALGLTVPLSLLGRADEVIE
jgi:putative ABC transport system substrate-binding protein